ncbi:MAG TPA: diacylglycerol kinase family protein [Actinomycetota bacterium]|nr:diacylglycerol kinase family protein [Actinomycetota bacterium]
MDTVLVVWNAHAGSVSRRRREVIVKALQADFKLDVAETQARNHAAGLARDAVDRGFDAVLAFGGDGTVNEVAQGLVGTDVALGIVPGGSTNVLARAVGVPRDPVEATAFVASRLRSGTRRRIGVGRLDDRYFLFSAGMGLDAEVVRRVEQDPEGKRRNAEGVFVANALKVALTRYRGAAAGVTLAVPGAEPQRVVFAVCGNGRPFTYYKRWPVDACPAAHLDRGLDVLGLTKVRTVTIPHITWSLFVSRSHVRWRTARYFSDVSWARLAADEPLPVQVDGDYLGERDAAHLEHVPDALDLLV